MSSLAPRKEARKVAVGRSGGGNGALTQREKRREKRRKRMTRRRRRQRASEVQGWGQGILGMD